MMVSAIYWTIRAVLLVVVVLLFPLGIDAQTSAFTYQGHLIDNMATASGTFQMQFALFDALSGGTQLGAPIENLAVNVNNGSFSVQLDYGAAAFTGAERYLSISVRRNSGESYVTLAPRQRITSQPYAVRASYGGIVGTAFTTGPSVTPTSTVAFLGPTVTVIASSGQKIFVASNVALGASGAPASFLTLYICYQRTGGAYPVNTWGQGTYGLTAAANTRQLYGLTAIINNPPAGTYAVGLCGNSLAPANWNNNEYGYTSAFVIN